MARGPGEGGGVPQRVRLGKEDAPTDLLVRLAKRAVPEVGNAPLGHLAGPFDGKINASFRLDFPGVPPLLLRFRVSRAFRYEPLVKEKLLYPLLDGSLDPFARDFGRRVARLVRQAEGRHEFAREPLLPAPRLYLWDETRRACPYLYSVKEFVPGLSLFDLLRGSRGKDGEGRPPPVTRKNLVELHRELGSALGRLHGVQFDGFYERVTELGNSSKRVTWPELFWGAVERELREAERNPGFAPLANATRRYLKDAAGLVEEDEVPVVFHNDWQHQNFVVQRERWGGRWRLAAVIDYDNWRVGTRAQEFVKLFYWSLGDDEELGRAFVDGYEREGHRVDAEFWRKVDACRLLWFMVVYNFEVDKVRKSEQNPDVDERFPAAKVYLEEIAKLVEPFA
ncbi:MAG: hypothetical protein Kow0069_00410 [Promethearchaeota archaeon]